MTEPVSAQNAPYAVDVEEGKSYLGCACGLSKTQPFCDCSHSGTGIVPVRYSAEKAEQVFFCGCKRTGDTPMCDGTHNGL